MTIKPELCLLVLALTGALFAENVKYSYDELGRLARAEYASGLVIAYTYDKSGNLTRRELTGNASPAQATAQSSSKPSRKAKKGAK